LAVLVVILKSLIVVGGELLPQCGADHGSHGIKVRDGCLCFIDGFKGRIQSIGIQRESD
jgi:hypothetical protein